MKIWLLDKNINITSNENYRFYKEAISSGIEYEFIAVDDFDLLIASEPNYNKPYPGQPNKGVDCIISCLGSGYIFRPIRFMAS